MKGVEKYMIFKRVPSTVWKRLSFYINEFKEEDINKNMYICSVNSKALLFKIQKRTDYHKIDDLFNIKKKKKGKVVKDEFEDQRNIVLNNWQKRNLVDVMSAKFDWSSYLEQKFEEMLYKFIFKRRRGRIYMSFIPEKFLLFYRFNNFFIKSGNGLRAFRRVDEILALLRATLRRAKGFALLLYICNNLFPIYAKGYLKKGKRFHFVAKDPDCNQKYGLMLTWLFKSLKGKRYSMHGIHYDDVKSSLLDTLRRRGNAFSVQNKFYDVIDENSYLLRRYKKKYKPPLSGKYAEVYMNELRDEYRLNFFEKRKKDSVSLWMLKKRINYKKNKIALTGDNRKTIGFTANFAGNEFF